MPTITTTNEIIVLSGESVTLECLPSNSDLEFVWYYETANDSGPISFQSEGDEDPVPLPLQFSIPSRNLYQIILPVADITDTGNYTCIIQGPPDDNVVISETISLTVEPGG